MSIIIAIVFSLMRVYGKTLSRALCGLDGLVAGTLPRTSYKMGVGARWPY